MATLAVLRTVTIPTVAIDIEITKSITALALTKDKEYMITMNGNDWYDHEKADQSDTTYPVTVGNILVTGYGYFGGTDQTYPDSFELSYYAGDLSFNFQQTN